MSELKAEELEHIAYMQTIEIQSLNARIAELEATVEIHADISNAYEKRISEIVSLSNKANAKLQSRITELEAAQRWIPVSERLPEESQQILSTDGKEFYLDYYARWEGKDNPPCFCDNLSWAVTHWMPLPQPPEVQE